MVNKKDNIIKKKRTSIFLTVSILFLVALWIAEVFVGVLNEFEAESVKSLNGKKVVFLLDEFSDKSNDLNPIESNKQGPVTAKMISLIIKLPDSGNIQEVLDALPKEVNFAISQDDKNFDEKKDILNKAGVNYLIKIPLENKKTDKKTAIYPHIDEDELSAKLENLLEKSSAIGVYHEGNEDFIKEDLFSFANIISFLNKKNLFLLYGVNGKTTIFESDSENIFSVEACDDIVKVDEATELSEKITKALNLSSNKEKSVLLIKANQNFVNQVNELLLLLKEGNLILVPLNQLPKSINTFHG